MTRRASTRSPRSSRSEAAVSRRWIQGRILHELASRSSSCMWKRCCASTSTGPSCARRYNGGKGGDQVSGGMHASHGSGSTSEKVMGDDLEGVSIRVTHSSPRCSVMCDQSRG